VVFKDTMPPISGCFFSGLDDGGEPAFNSRMNRLLQLMHLENTLEITGSKHHQKLLLTAGSLFR
jgi:hypothetical protein